MEKQNFFTKMADLFLESDKIHIDWLKEPQLKKAFYFLFLSFIPLLLLKICLNIFLRPLENSFAFSLGYRITQLVFQTIMLFTLAFLTIKYYNFMVQTKNKIYFSNIILFYIFSVVIFSYCYLTLYKLDQNYFNHPADFYNYGDIIKYSEFNLPTTLQFIFYSLFQSVNSGTKELSSNSLIVSVYNYLQNIYTIGLLSLLVSSFVNRQSSHKK